MGFILASGVLVRLREALPHLNEAELRSAAERIAAGTAVADPALSPSIVHDALAGGFGWVMVYGSLGVWVMAAISFFVFNARSVPQTEVQCSD
jgi:hypothetical protein